MNKKDRCKKEIYYGSWGRGRQCSRMARVDGFCIQHHPDTIKKREQEAQERAEMKYENSHFVQLSKARKEIEMYRACMKRAYRLAQSLYDKALFQPSGSDAFKLVWEKEVKYVCNNDETPL